MTKQLQDLKTSQRKKLAALSLSGNEWRVLINIILAQTVKGGGPSRQQIIKETGIHNKNLNPYLNKLKSLELIAETDGGFLTLIMKPEIYGLTMESQSTDHRTQNTAPYVSSQEAHPVEAASSQDSSPPTRERAAVPPLGGSSGYLVSLNTHSSSSHPGDPSGEGADERRGGGLNTHQSYSPHGALGSHEPPRGSAPSKPGNYLNHFVPSDNALTNRLSRYLDVKMVAIALLKFSSADLNDSMDKARSKQYMERSINEFMIPRSNQRERIEAAKQIGDNPWTVDAAGQIIPVVIEAAIRD